MTDLRDCSNQVAKYCGIIILSKKKEISWIDSDSFIIIRNIKANESRNAHVIHVSDSFLLQIDSFRLFQQMESGRETGNVDNSILNFEYYRNRQILLFFRYGGRNTPVFKKVYLIEIYALYCNDLALNQLSIIL